MQGWSLIEVLAAATRELTLFAAIGLAIGGLDDLLVDLIYLARIGRDRLRGVQDQRLADVPEPTRPLAVFVAAWDESAVIGAMLRTAAARLTSPHVRIYVGVYPNDWATIEAVAEVAETDRRVRMVIGPRAGPTTKADCLNAVWRAMLADEELWGWRFHAIALHDAEDVVHAGEHAVFEHGLATHDAVQLPVLPLPDRGSRFVGGTYLDEFAEAHGKQMLVRQQVGAGLPFAGVGCAIERGLIGRLAEARGGAPFDAASLTEDYELGLTLKAMGGRIAFARVTEAPGGLPVAVRAYFPGRFDAAVRQKARWMIGIALAGWDRTGWGRAAHFGEHWMRARDRRAPLAVLVLLAAYGAALLWAVLIVRGWLGGAAVRVVDPLLGALLALNGGLLAWRLSMRAVFVGRIYGAAEAALSVPRLVVGNIVALAAARRAVTRYIGMLRGARLHWDKTAHHFPTELTGPAA